MSETKALFDILRQTADGRSVDAIERLVRDGSDRDLCRINALSFATAANVDVEHAIAAFLHASQRHKPSPMRDQNLTVGA